MRFTIRHLLWFTLLASVACWWWLPSAKDARRLFDSAWYSPTAFKLQRYQFERSAIEENPLRVGEIATIDFKHRDMILFEVNNWADEPTPLHSRGRGLLVLV